MRIIDADALLEKMKRTGRYFAVKFDIEEMPTIDPDSLRPHGRWEESESGFLVCSECADVFILEEWLADGKWKYCPNCGAMMDEDEVNVCRKVVKL